MDSLEELQKDLWARWRQAFDRFAEVEQASRQGERTVYARVPLFDLTKYDSRKFLPGGRMLKELPEDASSHYTYRLDRNGRPVHMACRHAFNKIDWQGLYRYTDDEVECIEFCIGTGAVSEYIRIALHNGVRVSTQHLKVNGGGSHLAGWSGKDAIAFIAENSFNRFIDVEEYESANGRILSGRAVFEGQGMPVTRSTLAYTYSEKGKLQQVVRSLEDGRKSTEFAAPTRRNISDLADGLSKKIAARVIEELMKVDFGSPLLCAELSFRHVTNYVPSIIPVTERDFLARPRTTPAAKPKYWIDFHGQDFEPEMTEFTDRLDTSENWDRGTSMLRSAALQITQRVPELLPTADCFVAFPIDWEIEGHALEAILAECGATPEKLKKLKTIGWLD